MINKETMTKLVEIENLDLVKKSNPQRKEQTFFQLTYQKHKKLERVPTNKIHEI